MADALIPRRSLFAALLAAPVIAHGAKAAARTPRSGFIWVEVPEQPWRDFLCAARNVADLDRAR